MLPSTLAVSWLLRSADKRLNEYKPPGQVEPVSDTATHCQNHIRERNDSVTHRCRPSRLSES
jgi:hypothetical protein